MPSFEATIEFEVYCEDCNNGLCNQSTTTKTRNRQADCLHVEPCTKCLDKSYDKGFEEGDAAGYERAKKEFEKHG